MKQTTHKRRFSFGSFFLGLLLGAGVGAAAGLLLAPRTGEETLSQLRRRLQKGQQQAGKVTGESSSQLKAMASNGQSMIGAKWALLRQAFAAGKQAALEKHQQLSTIEDIGRKDTPHG